MYVNNIIMCVVFFYGKFQIILAHTLEILEHLFVYIHILLLTISCISFNFVAIHLVTIYLSELCC